MSYGYQSLKQVSLTHTPVWHGWYHKPCMPTMMFRGWSWGLWSLLQDSPQGSSGP